jgi:hypothetical protein
LIAFDRGGGGDNKCLADWLFFGDRGGVVMAMVGGDWYGELTFRMRRRLIKINELIGSSPTAACPLACLRCGIPIVGVPWHPCGGVVVGCCSSEGVMGV